MMHSNSSDNCVNCYVEILNFLDPELQLINTKPMIKNKLKELLSEFEKFKAQTILVLEYKKRNDCKIFHSSNKPIPVVTIQTFSLRDVILRDSIRVFEG